MASNGSKIASDPLQKEGAVGTVSALQTNDLRNIVVADAGSAPTIRLTTEGSTTAWGAERKRSLGRMKTRSPAWQERLRLIVFLYRSGESTAAIAAAIGITRQRVQQLLILAGCERRGRGNPYRDAIGRYSNVPKYSTTP